MGTTATTTKRSKTKNPPPEETATSRTPEQKPEALQTHEEGPTGLQPPEGDSAHSNEPKKPTRAPPSPREPLYSRAAAFVDALRIGGTYAGLTDLTIQLYAERNPTKTEPKPASVEWAIRDYCAPLLILGLVTRDRDGKLTLTEK